MSKKKKKILIYNWTQFDNKDGGGVTVYIDNILNDLKENKNLELYFLSSGSKYDLLRNKMRVKKTKNKYGEKVKSYTIYNSPVMFAYNQFSRVDIYNEDKKIAEMFNNFIEEHGEFDVIHFNNLEGLSKEVLKLKEKYPNTKFIYSMHNYFPVCPNVYLWKHNKENCKDYNYGKDCCNCIISNYNSSKLKLKLRTLLEKFGITPQTKWLIKLHNKIKTKNNSQPSTKEITCPCTGEDYKKFREQNVLYINKYVDEVLCVSKRVREIAIKHGIDEKKCHISYIGTKFANNLQRQEIDVESEKFNLIYLGYMNIMKGFDFLVKSLMTLDKKVSKNINLYLVCRNNNEYNIEEIKEKLEKRFNTVTYIDGYTHQTLPSLLEGKHLGVIPVVWEDNLPQVSIEITSFGVPILASDLGGASELCESSDFKYQGGNSKDFNQKLTNIVNNRNKLQDFWKYYNNPTTMDKHLNELYRYYGIKELKK